MGGRWCADQAIHQALLWKGRFAEVMDNVTVYTNERGPLGTIGDGMKWKINEYYEVCDEDGEPVGLLANTDVATPYVCNAFCTFRLHFCA